MLHSDDVAMVAEYCGVVSDAKAFVCLLCSFEFDGLKEESLLRPSLFCAVTFHVDSGWMTTMVRAGRERDLKQQHTYRATLQLLVNACKLHIGERQLKDKDFTVLLVDRIVSISEKCIRCTKFS